MSFLPYILRDMTRSLRMLENHFRLTDEMFHPISSPFLRPRLIDHDESPDAVIRDKDKIQVKLDVKDFKADEITVKALDGNSIQIEAKHEDGDKESGYISKHFVRRFVLPRGHDLKDVVSSLSSSGVLTITAPRKPELEGEQERVIPITHVNAEKKIEEKKS